VSDKCCAPACGRVCGDASKYVEIELRNPPKKVILACEGGCVKGEIARVAANMLAYRLHREDSVRICLGDAVTGNSGMIDLVQRATEIIAIEGCPLNCGTEIMKRRLPDFKASIVNASSLYSYDKTKFEIFDMSRGEIEEHAQTVVDYISKQYY
jgi:uncharacterized metal-binding protein